MWRGHEAQIFEIRHHIANARRTELQCHAPSERPGTHGLAITNVVLDQRAQNLLRAFCGLGLVSC